MKDLRPDQESQRNRKLSVCKTRIRILATQLADTINELDNELRKYAALHFNDIQHKHFKKTVLNKIPKIKKPGRAK